MACAANPNYTWPILPLVNARRDLRGIWGTSDTNLWTVGANGRIARYNGNDWSATDQGANALSGIWGSSANDIWVVGANGFVYHYNGTTWQPTSSQSLTNHDLTGVWSDRKGNVWAVGNSSVGAGTIFKY